MAQEDKSAPVPLTFRVTPDTAEQWKRVSRTQSRFATRAFEIIVSQLERSILRRLTDDERARYMRGEMDRAGWEQVLIRHDREKGQGRFPKLVSA